MTNLEQAARQALQALENINNTDSYWWQEVDEQTIKELDDAEKALRQALEPPKQVPFEYWSAVEGWVKIDEVREHFDSVGCGTIYKTAGEGRVPLAIAQPKQKPVAWMDLHEELGQLRWMGNDAGWDCAINAVKKRLEELALYTEPLQHRLESTTDMMMELVDRLGELPNDVDPRAWEHLLVYAPKRKWVGLTDDEVAAALIDVPLGNGYFLRIARAIESKLKG